MKFFNKRDTQVEDCVKWLNLFYKKENADLSNKKDDKKNSWYFMDIDPFILNVLIHYEDGRHFLQLISNICEIPEENILPFYRKCLEINAELDRFCLAIQGMTISLNLKQPIFNLSQDELEDIIYQYRKCIIKVFKSLSNEFGVEEKSLDRP